jgi:hypothetical protein
MEHPSMDNHAVQDMIKEIVETSEFEPLFNYLSDDVVFKVTIPPGTPISGEFRPGQAQRLIEL